MPKQTQKAEFNSFVKGLITEASPLNFPANASFEEENFDLSRSGTRSRRNGLDFEPETVLRPVTYLSGIPPVSFKWVGVGGNPSLTIIVVQGGTNLYFFNADATSLSGTGYLGSLDLRTIIGGLYPRYSAWSFTSVDGFLVVAAGTDVITVISYDGSVFTPSYGRLQVRDVWGIDVNNDQIENDPSFRPSTANIFHFYNLQNQSWGIPRKADVRTVERIPVTDPETGVVTITEIVNIVPVIGDPVSKYFMDLGKYPSNSETVWAGLQFQPVEAGANPYEKIFTNLYEDALGADTKAAKGYYVIDLLRRGGSREDAYSNNKNKYPELNSPSIAFPADFSEGGAALVCEFAGRVFYAGFSGKVVGGDSRSPNLTNFILFSQLVRNQKDFFKCYQDGDPTSRENNEVVDTDGGFIKISGAQGILGIVPMGTSLIVIAENGVWAIKGGSDYGFTATNYKVDNISSFGGISRFSIVEDGDRVFFWGEDGIYVIARDQFGELSVKSITEETIQTLYTEIPNTAKAESVGVYDSVNKTVRWLYKLGTPFSSDSATYELIFNLTLGAFSQNRIVNTPLNDTEAFSLFSSTRFNSQTQVQLVVVGSEIVQVTGVDVGIPDTGRVNPLQSTRYLTIKSTSTGWYVGFAYYNNTQFKDWGLSDAAAYMITGEQIAGDSSVHKQTPYLTMHFQRTENGVDVDGVPINQSSCLVRSRWDWAKDESSNKFSPEFEAYRYKRVRFSENNSVDDFNTGFKTVVTKNKLRGRGKAFAMSLRSSPGKDCVIHGWNLAINGNAIT